MTQDEIVEMARQAGIHGDAYLLYQHRLEAFAKLVAAKEREACATICDELGEHWSDYKDTALLNGDVNLSNAASGEPRAAMRLAIAIRARGEA